MCSGFMSAARYTCGAHAHHEYRRCVATAEQCAAAQSPQSRKMHSRCCCVAGVQAVPAGQGSSPATRRL